MKSIRIFLILAIVAVTTLASFISVIHGYRRSMQASEQLFDTRLNEVAALLAQLSVNQIEPLQQDHFSNPLTDYPDTALQIWDDQGQSIARIATQLESLPSPPFNEMIGYDNFANARWRVVMRHYPQWHRWVWLAEQQDVRFQLAEGLVLESIAPSLLVLPLLAVLIWVIVRRGLMPIKNLETQIASKEAKDLSPLRLDQVPQELTDLTNSVNLLFDRLAQSFAREKRLASDAAHELRTPIATLLLQVDNLAAKLQQPDDVEQLRQTATRLSHLLEQILVLNKTTPELFEAKMQPMKMMPVLREVVASYYPQIEAQQHSIELLGEDATIATDAYALSTLFANLLSNAIKYTPAGGKIRISLNQSKDRVSLIVEDSGTGIPDEAHERVLERFYRLGGDRNDSQVEGCGLGLAIVKHLVELHKAELRFAASQFSSGLAVNVTFKRYDA